MGLLRMGLFRQFTGFDFLFTLIGLGFWISYLIWKDDAIIRVLGEKWKKSKFRKFFARILFHGWLLIGGLVLGFFPDGWWVGLWKVALLLVVLFIIFLKKEKNKKVKTDTDVGVES